MSTLENPQVQVSEKDMANAIRALSMDAVQKANSGHPGLPMGMADVATVLFTKILKFDASDPNWADRDRFILSGGHGSMLLYSLLHLLGYEDMTLDQIENFRQLGAITAGHPEYGHASGVETTTGPLGQGFANSVGFALAERIMNARFGDDLVDHFTYVFCGDGDLMEGISQEALTLAGHLKLSKLIVLFDDNDISIDGAISLTDATDQLARFQASGWDVARVDGHDPHAVEAAILAAQKTGTPSLIACKTIIGYGAPTKQGTAATHGSPLGEDEVAGAREKLGWPHAPFNIPNDIVSAWRAAGGRGRAARQAWEARLASSNDKAEFTRRMAGDLPGGLDDAITAYKQKLIADQPKVATRKASEMALDVINEVISETIGGSADLTGSNNTRSKGMEVLDADNFGGRFIHYGIREHGMAAAMNGLALHGGVIPYSGTFLVFTDYCRPSIRLSALMGLRVVYVMTHDSIGLGEDGPTHQPVEHLAALRAMPNLNVFRPADVVETAECWQAALEDPKTPSVIALTRQGLPCVRSDSGTSNRCLEGAYELASASGEAMVTIFATGSEVEIALAARQTLESEGVATRVVSVPSFEKFASRSKAEQKSVIGSAPVRIAVEAGVEQGWSKFLGDEGVFIGMSSFGASAPLEDLYNHFGITAEAIVAAAKEQLS
ncbi:MAG: transketolase [Alphaproteobacteria bacterium]|nr:MAG: transketolase [Alphaproteobacteria bacterium]